MQLHDAEQVADGIVRNVRDYIGREVAPLLARIAALESRQPEKGEQGDPGAPGESIKGEPGEPGPEGAAGRDGRDGRDAKGIDGIDGKDGKDGIDGLGFDDLDVIYDGERTLTLRFMCVDRVREFPCLLPIVLDRGVFKDSGSYERGDAVTWAGSLWIAQEPTGDKPDSGKGWRLAVKRGRDGEGRAQMTALVTLTEAKSQLRVDHNEEDADVMQKAAAASAFCINYVKLETPWTIETVPDDARAAVLMTLNWLFDDRSPGKPDHPSIAMGYPPPAIAALLHRYRDPALA